MEDLWHVEDFNKEKVYFFMKGLRRWYFEN